MEARTNRRVGRLEGEADRLAEENERLRKAADARHDAAVGPDDELHDDGFRRD